MPNYHTYEIIDWAVTSYCTGVATRWRQNVKAVPSHLSGPSVAPAELVVSVRAMRLQAHVNCCNLHFMLQLTRSCT